MPTSSQRLRYALDRTKGPNSSISDALVGGSLFFWDGNDLQLELAVFNNDVLDDISWIGTLTVEVKLSETDLGVPLMTKTVSSFDAALVLEDWVAGTAQHALVNFTNSESLLDLGGAASKQFWLVVSATSTDTPLHIVTLGGSLITAQEDATPQSGSGPVQGGNLIPGGATYSSGGAYTLSGLTANVNLMWVQGANDTSVVNGAQTVTVTNTVFVTQGTSVVLHGANNASVTAEIRNQIYLTADQTDARYIVTGSLPSTVMLKAANLSDVASASASRTNLGLDTAAVHPVAFFLQTANNLSDVTASTARTNLSVYSQAQVDTEVYALPAKRSVIAATTANITLSGAQTIDGISIVAGNRVLVKNQTSGADNGIYLCASGSWTRTTDFNASASVDYGILVFVQTGSVGAGTVWKLTTTGTITLATTALTFAVQAFFSSTYLLASNNLSDLVTPATARTNLGLDTAATHATAYFLVAGNNLSDLSSASVSRTNLGLDTAATHPATDFLLAASNLSDVATPATARTNLSVYSISQTDAEVYALPSKRSVQAATTGTITLVGTQTIDGYSAVADDRILVKNMGSSNGIWVVSTGAWARALDANTAAMLDYGMLVYVQGGTVNGGTTWELTTAGTITLGSTSLTFTSVTKSSAKQAGVGTNYTLTGSTAHVTFGTTNPDITTPGTGTFLMFANVAISGITANDEIHVDIYDSTNSVTVASGVFFPGGATPILHVAAPPYVQTALCAMQIKAYNATAVRGSIVSTTTTIWYAQIN